MSNIKITPAISNPSALKDSEKSTEDKFTIPDDPEIKVDRLTSLKKKADLLGIEYSNNIGEDTLADRIKTKLEGGTKEEPVKEEKVGGASPAAETKQQVRMRLYRDSMRLVRCRITNMDPNKASHPGEIITVQNSYIPKVSKFVPYGEQTDGGFHLPYIIYEYLKDRKFLQVRKTKDRKGREVITKRWVSEFALEVLPNLTEKEVKELAIRQAAADSAESFN